MDRPGLAWLLTRESQGRPTLLKSVVLARVEEPVSKAIIVELYEEMNGGGSVVRFARKVGERYNEGTLHRLLRNHDPSAREATLVALRHLGTMASNEAVAACLLDRSTRLRDLAEGALWAIWFRADRPEHNQELQRYAEQISAERYEKAIAGINRLIEKAPKFAEAYNQRANVFFLWGDYKNAISDCERVVRLNRLHFGAYNGMAKSYLRLNRPVEALRAFRQAQKIHPGLDGVRENIQGLEEMLREERRRNKEDRRQIE